jgi:NNP family nitrate/nitrite transporter-like MFS transporter
MSATSLRLFDFKDPKVRTLHLSWFAFFISFMVWFNFAPLLVYMKRDLGLTDGQAKTLMLLNVALTIPSRIAVGMLVDRFGPRRMYTYLLGASGTLCFAFALAKNFEQLALLRFLMGFTGAGFVIGIRLVGEWFPARQVGLAEGIYGGWGNFGSAAAAVILPGVAVAVGGEQGWRVGLAITGAVSLVYAFYFYARARNTPKGSTYFKPKKSGGLEVTSKGDLFFLLAMNLPMYGALAVLTWRLGPGRMNLLSVETSLAAYGVVALLAYVQTAQILRVNRELFKHEVPPLQRYKFKQVAILDLGYMAAFGAELAVVSMLPLFYLETFPTLSPIQAAMSASSFAFMNLVARPLGGYLSDHYGRRRVLSLLIAGLAVGFLAMSRVDGTWPLAAAVAVTMCCSFFVQAACGAVFAMVPLVQRRMTGQIAGMVGAYGNVGGVVFLTALSFVDYSTFFIIIGGSSLIAFLATQLVDEPKGHMAEVLEDGTVQLLEVS